MSELLLGVILVASFIHLRLLITDLKKEVELTQKKLRLSIRNPAMARKKLNSEDF